MSDMVLFQENLHNSIIKMHFSIIDYYSGHSESDKDMSFDEVNNSLSIVSFGSLSFYLNT